MVPTQFPQPIPAALAMPRSPEIVDITSMGRPICIARFTALEIGMVPAWIVVEDGDIAEYAAEVNGASAS